MTGRDGTGRIFSVQTFDLTTWSHAAKALAFDARGCGW